MLHFVRASTIGRMQVYDHNTAKYGSRPEMTHKQPGSSYIDKIDLEIARLLGGKNNSTTIYGYLTRIFFYLLEYK